MTTNKQKQTKCLCSLTYNDPECKHTRTFEQKVFNIVYDGRCEDGIGYDEDKVIRNILEAHAEEMREIKAPILNEQQRVRDMYQNGDPQGYKFYKKRMINMNKIINNKIVDKHNNQEPDMKEEDILATTLHRYPLVVFNEIYEKIDSIEYKDENNINFKIDPLYKTRVYLSKDIPTNPRTDKPYGYSTNKFRCTCGNEVDPINWNYLLKQCRECCEDDTEGWE